jgi:uncharacterized protein YndB with AHSA1/START domain
MSSLLHSVKVKRVLNASPEVVFDAFSSAEMLTQWFSPSADIEIELSKFSFSEGDEFSLHYTMPDGSKPVVSGVFEVIDRPKSIIFTWMWSEPDPHAGIPTRVIVHLAHKAGKTDLVLTHDKLPKHACERHIAGWEATLERLNPVLKSLTKMEARDA